MNFRGRLERGPEIALPSIAGPSAVISGSHRRASRRRGPSPSSRDCLRLEHHLRRAEAGAAVE
eukprot:9425132-Pyramimonas_sp.AAC.1